MQRTADAVLGRGVGLWGEGKLVRRKIKGVGGGGGLRTDPQRKKRKWEVVGCRKNSKRKMNGGGGKWTVDGSAEKRANM